MEYGGNMYYYQYNLQGDVTGLYDSNFNKVVYYLYDSWGKLLEYGGSMADTIGTANPFRYRGYFYDEETGFYYLNSRYYDPETGRFINADGILGVNPDMTTYNLYAYCGNNSVSRYDLCGMSWEAFIDDALHFGNDVLIAIGIDTAAVGASFLDMEKDDKGVYHATFNCWQQDFGYNDLYDYVFDVGTSMDRAKFNFSYNGSDYTIWAWKGDYINLGAGAELGIYRNYSGIRVVDKSLAMWMSLILSYKDKWIIEYFPTDNQWWITGFNPKYQNVNANDLTATLGVGFNSSGMYFAFKNSIKGKDSRWSFYDSVELAIFQF